MRSGTQAYPGFRARIFGFAPDYSVVAAYLTAVALIGLIINRSFPNALPKLFSDPVTGQITGLFSVTFTVMLYLALLESSPRQATWGKRRRRLKVVSTNGERLSRGRPLGRAWLKFIPWELAHTCIWQVPFAGDEPSNLIAVGFVLVWVLIGINMVWLWLSPSNQTLYDQVVGTRVVKE